MREWAVPLSGDHLAKVRFVDRGRELVYVELQSGHILVLSSEDDDNEGDKPEVDDVVLVSESGDIVDFAPPELWLTRPFVGVVRHKGAEKTLLQIGSLIQAIDTVADPAYDVGNTVEALITGVVKVVSNEAVTAKDFFDEEDSVASYVLPSGSTGSEGYEDIGGYDEVKERVRTLLEAPLRFEEELAEIGANPVRGVLFAGPPGTGKTKLARIVANQTDAKFYLISGPQIFNKYYGSSEKIVRQIFDDVRRQRSIIFIDEIDSIASRRGDDSHEVSRRVVAQLLTQMDGLQNADRNVIVVAATNRPQDLDDALLRPGRFDWTVYFDLPSKEERRSILDVTSRALNADGGLPLEAIAERTEGWAPADIASIWNEAALIAASDRRRSIGAEDLFAGVHEVARQLEQKRLAMRGGGKEA